VGVVLITQMFAGVLRAVPRDQRVAMHMRSRGNGGRGRIRLPPRAAATRLCCCSCRQNGDRATVGAVFVVVITIFNRTDHGTCRTRVLRRSA